MLRHLRLQLRVLRLPLHADEEHALLLQLGLRLTRHASSHLHVAAVLERARTRYVEEEHYASLATPPSTAQVAHLDALPQPVAVRLAHLRALRLAPLPFPYQQELQIRGSATRVVGQHTQRRLDRRVHALAQSGQRGLHPMKESRLHSTAPNNPHLPSAILPHETAVHHLTVLLVATPHTPRISVPHPSHQRRVVLPVPQLQHRVHGAHALEAQHQEPQTEEHVDGESPVLGQTDVLRVGRGHTTTHRLSPGLQERRAGLPHGRGVGQRREERLQVVGREHAVVVLVVQTRQLRSHTATHAYAVQKVQSLRTPLGVLVARGERHVVRLDLPLQLVVVATRQRATTQSPQRAQHHPARLAAVLLEEQLHQLQKAAARDALLLLRQRAETARVRVLEVLVESAHLLDGERGGEAVLLG